MDSGLKTSQKLIIGLPRRDQRSKSWERLTLCQVRSCSDARFWKPSFIHPGRLQWKKDVYCISFCHRLFEKTSPHYIATHKLLNEHLWLLTGTGTSWSHGFLTTKVTHFEKGCNQLPARNQAEQRKRCFKRFKWCMYIRKHTLLIPILYTWNTPLPHYQQKDVWDTPGVHVEMTIGACGFHSRTVPTCYCFFTQNFCGTWFKLNNRLYQKVHGSEVSMTPNIIFEK